MITLPPEPYQTVTWTAPFVQPSPEFLKATDGLHGVYFRREFDVSGPVKAATLRVIGLGQFRLFVNGEAVGKAVFFQPWSEYGKRLYETEFSIGPFLKAGKNVIGVSIGSSFWHETRLTNNRYFKGDAVNDSSNGQPILLSADLQGSTTAGGSFGLQTDSSWLWSPSPIVFSHELGGEDCDARLDQPGWSTPHLSESALKASWKQAEPAKPPSAEVSPIFWPEIEPERVFKPTKVLDRPDGSFTYVFPQNAMAVLKYTLNGKPGQKVVFTPSETMTKEGDVVQLNLWGQHMYWSYVVGSDHPETHRSQFQYFGFQYVKVEGAVPKGHPNPNHLPVIENIELVQIQTANKENGTFESSNPIFNGTERIIDWSIRSNMSYVFTDCPQREKMGWLECSYLMGDSMLYQWDCRKWLEKICVDIHDSQLPNGQVLTTAPVYLQRPPDDQYAFTTEWGAASVMLPWELYEWYGDRDILRLNYPMMKKYVEYLAKRSPDGIAPKGLGDWYDYALGKDPGPSNYTPTDLTSTATFAICLRSMVDAAKALGGHEDDIQEFQAEYAKVKNAFWKRFYNPATGELENSGSCQSGHAMALCAGLVPDQFKAQIVSKMVEDLQAKDWQQTPGDVGHVWFIRAMAENGLSSDLFRVYERTGTGSYGGVLAKGLTTMPETWDARTEGSNSLNHAMLGHVVEWFYGWVAGIRQAPGSVGWNQIIIGPNVGNLKSAAASIEIPAGRVSSRWTHKNGVFRLEVAVPAAAGRTCLLPRGCTDATLNGKPVTPDATGGIDLPAGKSLVEAKLATVK